MHTRYVRSEVYLLFDSADPDRYTLSAAHGIHPSQNRWNRGWRKYLDWISIQVGMSWISAVIPRDAMGLTTGVNRQGAFFYCFIFEKMVSHSTYRSTSSSAEYQETAISHSCFILKLQHSSSLFIERHFSPHKTLTFLTQFIIVENKCNAR
jgi:hypothetical protein